MGFSWLKEMLCCNFSPKTNHPKSRKGFYPTHSPFGFRALLVSPNRIEDQTPSPILCEKPLTTFPGFGPGWRWWAFWSVFASVCVCVKRLWEIMGGNFMHHKESSSCSRGTFCYWDVSSLAERNEIQKAEAAKVKHFSGEGTRWLMFLNFRRLLRWCSNHTQERNGQTACSTAPVQLSMNSAGKQVWTINIFGMLLHWKNMSNITC